LLFSIRSSASLTKNDILPPLSYVLIFSFYHICFFLPIMQWSSLLNRLFLPAHAPSQSDCLIYF
ncbi:hypothetical protein, partial [Candidatus Bandiella numerosa]|uniref:hypothetical protein n=1 Tax=Candidatus Bandiella numerosa TaxID=2570586 RepID=UPI001F1A92D5